MERIATDGLQKSYNCYEWNITDITTIQTSSNLWNYSYGSINCWIYVQGYYNFTTYSLYYYDSYPYINPYLNLDFQKTDSSGNTCTYKNPYIYNNVNTLYKYNATNTYETISLLFLQEQLIPYNFTIEMADGTPLSTPSGLINIYLGSFNSSYRYDPYSSNSIAVTFHIEYHPTFYESSITYQLNFKVSLFLTST